MILLFAIYFRKKVEIKSLMGDKRLHGIQNLLNGVNYFIIFYKSIQILKIPTKIPCSLFIEFHEGIQIS